MSYGIIRRVSTISNNTRIQYLSVANAKIYKVTNIDFHNLTIEANETDLSIEDVPENELWNISYFDDFHIKLVNGDGGGGMGEIVDFVEWVERHKDVVK